MNTLNLGMAGTLIVIASLLFGPAAGAAEQRTLDVRDLDPKTPAGAMQIHRLITQAANDVCGVTRTRARSIAELRDAEQAHHCAETAIAAAVLQVNAAAHVDLEYLAGVRPREVRGLANVPTNER